MLRSVSEINDCEEYLTVDIFTEGNTTQDRTFSNILKLYHILYRHIMHFPEENNRFPGLQRAKKTKLAKGAQGPLEGILDLAEYFVGNSLLSVLNH